MKRHDMLDVTPAPQDYISDATIFEDNRLFAVTCWDGSVSLYSYNTDKVIELKVRLIHKYALTSCCYVETNRKLYVGSVQGEILEVDFEAEIFQEIINNRATLGISSICKYQNSIICGSWDGWLQIIDCDTNIIQTHHKLDSLKILCMDTNEDKLLVATTSNKIMHFKLPFNPNYSYEVESGLKYQARKVGLTPDGKGYVSSSLDGRVAVEYFDDDEKKFAFRCHRMNLVDINFVFPVNALAFIPDRPILYTGGSDGCISCWNINSRKKIEQFPKLDGNSVVHLKCNKEILLAATSDDSFKTSAVIHEDMNELQPSKLYILYL